MRKRASPVLATPSSRKEFLLEAEPPHHKCPRPSSQDAAFGRRGRQPPLRPQRIAIDAVAVFSARAEARAILWREGELTLHEAVDALWAAAVRGGLVTRLGADHVQRILADAFVPVRGDLARDEDVVPDLVEEEPLAGSAAFSTPTDGLSVTFAAACRQAASNPRPTC